MGNIKCKDEMDLIYIYVDWTDWNKEYQRTRRSWHWYNVDFGSTNTLMMGIESWEQITEAIENGTENIKVQNMNNSEQQGYREHRWQY
jgi:hypothetical protein